MSTSSDTRAHFRPDVWRRLDGPVLVSNLVAGVVWLLLTTFLWGGLGVLRIGFIGVAYVVACSVFFAAVYAKETLALWQELLTWFGPWMVAWILLLVGVLADGDLGDVGGWASEMAASVLWGVMLGIPYLIWHVVALAIRQLIAWRAGRSTSSAGDARSADESRSDRG